MSKSESPAARGVIRGLSPTAKRNQIYERQKNENTNNNDASVGRSIVRRHGTDKTWLPTTGWRCLELGLLSIVTIYL